MAAIETETGRTDSDSKNNFSAQHRNHSPFCLYLAFFKNAATLAGTVPSSANQKEARMSSTSTVSMSGQRVFPPPLRTSEKVGAEVQRPAKSLESLQMQSCS